MRLGIKEINAAAYSATAEVIPILRMVKNDTRTYIVQFNVPKEDGGVSLAGMKWVVHFENAEGVPGDQPCKVVEESGENIIVQWLVEGIAAGAVGNTKFQLDGTGSDGRKWQSDIYFNEVGESMFIAPAYTPAICGAGVCGEIVCGKE